MSDYEKLKETLSALVDDEAGKIDQLELRRLARSLENYPDLIEIYQRYTLTHAVMSGDVAHVASTNFVANVQAALDQENMAEIPAAHVVSPKIKTNTFNWFKSAGRVAIAASVAVVAVYLVQTPSSSSPPALSTTVALQPPIKDAVTDSSNRILNPRVMTVSAGDGQASDRPVESQSHVSAGCEISALRADSSDLIWEKELPAGYVLCKQNDQSKECESASSKIGCYLN